MARTGSTTAGCLTLLSNKNCPQEQARELINAERCSMFLLDEATDELCAKSFDIGAASDEFRVRQSKSSWLPTFETPNRYEFPLGTLHVKPVSEH